MIRASLDIRSGTCWNRLFSGVMVFVLLSGYAKALFWRSYAPAIIRYCSNSGLRVLAGSGVFLGGAAGSGKENPAITKESRQPLVILSVSDTGGELLKGGLPRLMDEKRLQSVARGKI